ncbi:eukaryotic translation initiation factor 4 gamma 1a isoform X1 [Polypterus senegalus]|uniref:eukaryotic translation initiation factor 4 gamma 1a isoform X1 n=1 Tax=Polypterus senegalus TaxID=55291 RepID=UPI001963ED71|nr:eukaryotic translation initiation factor 4 gamma 1a isoform X1 [Polypterus senegalus]XP_039621187.1 eukaryotic translation initiation factor 4 gamma 1a isoform X1 [Polypterus senegalus]
MNKAPQPIAGPPTAPLPAPSPGLSQTAFPPGQAGAPVVFATPQPPQMNTPPQPRQGGFRSLQQYYANRQPPPSSASRVPASTAPRAVTPTHVYQTGSQMMMIPQPLPFPASQGSAYYIQGGQYRSTYVAPTQQYPVPTGTPSFYPSSSPAEYGTYAGAYYPTQGVQQYPPAVPAAQVMMNPAQQIPPKRERKQVLPAKIRIRDPNQGGRDITEEIMSGGRTTSTPTPSQTGSSGLENLCTTQPNGESSHPVVIRPDDNQKVPVVLTKTGLEPGKMEIGLTPIELQMHMSEIDTKMPPLEKDVEFQEVIPANTMDSSSAVVASSDSCTDSTPPLINNFTSEEVKEEIDIVLAPVSMLVEQPAVEMPMEEEQVEETEQQLEVEEVETTIEEQPPVAACSLQSDDFVSAEENPPESNGVTVDPDPEPSQEPETPQVQCELPVESPIAQPEELKLTNGLAVPGIQDLEPSEEQPESDISPIAEPEVVPAKEEEQAPSIPVADDQEKEESLLQNAAQPVLSSQSVESNTQVPPVSVPKKKRKMKDLNKKEAVGDLLDAFKESQKAEPPAEPETTPQPVAPTLDTDPVRVSPPEETDETWEEKEDKLDSENVEPEPPKSGDQKYQYKEEQWKPINPEEKKQYDREFLLRFQFICASMQKPEGLPHISDVVLDKANKTPLRPLDPSRITGMNCGPDFTPSFANLGRQPTGGRGLPSGIGPRRSQQGQRKEPRKIIPNVSLNDDVQLNKAEKAWKPGNKRSSKDEEPDSVKTQELFRRVRSILNKLTPQMFQQLMKQVTELTIDTEERLKGVIDLIFEKAISEPNFSVAYANMCRCLITLKVPTTDKPGVTVNFRKLLLNRCQKEFEKDKDDDEVFEKKQQELDAASGDDEKQRLKEELEEAKDKARRRSLGNIKFIGELFKLKMLTEPIMHDCIVKLLKNHDEESLECLCRLLSTIGKDLDFEKAKPRMDQYFNQMEKIIKEKKTSSRIRFMLQDVLDLRRNNWIPRRGDQGPKTIDQIHKEAEMEEHREQIKVQQQLLSKKDTRRGGSGGTHSSVGRISQPQDEGWNTVPISTKNRPIDTSRLSKITKPGALDFNNQLLAPGGRLSWGKGSSGGSGAKPNEQAPEPGRPATSTLNRFSALQQSSSSAESDSRRVVQRSSSSRERSDRYDRGERSDRYDRGERFDRSDRTDRFERREGGERQADRNRPPITKRSYSKETDDRSREREHRGSQDPLRRVASMTEERDRSSRERDRSKESAKRESVATPVPSKPALSEDDMEKKSKSIIEEFLHINDMKEAMLCVLEMNSTSLLFIFVRHGIESTLERSTIAREHMGLLLYQLVKAGTLTKEQYYKGLQEILAVAEDMEIDIPHIWLYLAEIITPILHEGGIHMGELFREVTKPLVPLGKAGHLLVEILLLLCKEMSHKKAGALWREEGLSWKNFLPEDVDVNKFVTEKKVEFTLGDDSEKPSKKELSSEELCRLLDKLLQEKADNQRIYDWVEANLDEQQIVSNTFVRAVMTSVCQSAIIFENPYRVDSKQIVQRAKVLQKYLTDEQKELQALYALQALMVKLEQPPNLLRMFFDALYDEDVIKEEAFYKWESSKDPAELQGKGVALKSVTAFFTWLREAEDESDNN